GLTKLRRTYEGDPTKVRHLDDILTKTAGALQRAREGSTNGQKAVALREQFDRHLVYAIRQRTYLDAGKTDFCFFFVPDWARRILFNKSAYAVSSKRPAGYVSASRLTLAEHARMQKKADRIRPEQEKLRKNLEEGGSIPRTFSRYGRFAAIQTDDD